jgi:hypothetical protein
MDMFLTDLWRIGIIQAPIQQVTAAGSLDAFAVKWIEAERSLCFLADPFGFWRDGNLYLFAEFYDYRSRKGDIAVFVLDDNLKVIEQRTVLAEPWHLSYPVVFEADNEIWMLPEGYKSGQLNLYRATNFPWQWEKVPEFSFPCAAIDASPFFAQDKWWIFYTPPTPREARTSVLMLACADDLFGPWQNVSEQPIRQDKSGARMGGTPFIHDGKVMLPTQDCSQTYGGALRMLEMPLADLSEPQLSAGALLRAPTNAEPFTDGLHTLSAAGDVTLIDCKRVLRGSPHRIAVDLQRALAKRFKHSR